MIVILALKLLMQNNYYKLCTKIAKICKTKRNELIFGINTNVKNYMKKRRKKKKEGHYAVVSFGFSLNFED